MCFVSCFVAYFILCFRICRLARVYANHFFVLSLLLVVLVCCFCLGLIGLEWKNVMEMFCLLCVCLEQCERSQRSKLLEENVEYANKCLPRGLYLPIAHRASDGHRSLLRIVPKVSKCLASKQKVPFMLFCEVKRHAYPTSSPDIIEELVESTDAALLSGSGTYVLIDSNVSRNDGKHSKNRKKKKHGHKSNKNGKNHDDKAEHLLKKNNVSNGTTMIISSSGSNSNENENERENEESEEKTVAPRISKTISLSIGDRHTHSPPKIRETDSSAEQMMRHHLEALKSFEPQKNEKSLLTKQKLKDKHNLHASTSMTQLTGIGISSGNVSNGVKKRSKFEKFLQNRPIFENNGSHISNNISKAKVTANDAGMIPATQSQPVSRSNSVSSNSGRARSEPNSENSGTNNSSFSNLIHEAASKTNANNKKETTDENSSNNSINTNDNKDSNNMSFKVETMEATESNANGAENENDESENGHTSSPSLSTKSNPVVGSKGKVAVSLQRKDSTHSMEKMDDGNKLDAIKTSHESNMDRMESSNTDDNASSDINEINRSNSANDTTTMTTTHSKTPTATTRTKKMIEKDEQNNGLQPETLVKSHSDESALISSSKQSKAAANGHISNNNITKANTTTTTTIGTTSATSHYNHNHHNHSHRHHSHHSHSHVHSNNTLTSNTNLSNSSYLRHVRGKSLRWKDPFGEAWEKRKSRILKDSPFKKIENWDLQSVIFKSGEDMRQEQLAMQFIQLFDNIFKNARLPLQLRPYSVIVSSPASGFVETIPNAVSISGLKHSIKNFVSLRRFFEQFYGPPGSPSFENAQKNFIESMAAYSLVCYFLQIKDRHNGNILLDSEGRVIHIDFDFILSNSPGGNINFESSPFKLTEEFIEVMGGERDSDSFDYFQVW